jgi:hypothetical protein
MWSRPYLGIMVEGNCWTLFMVVSSHRSKHFASTCKRVWCTLRPLHTLVMKGPIMLSNLVLPLCFYSMQLTNPPRFSLIQIVTCLTSLLGRATWRTSLTVNGITLPAEFMLKFAICECENYASWRISNNKWLVVRSVECKVHYLIPCFHRVYTITLACFWGLWLSDVWLQLLCMQWQGLPAFWYT